MVREVGPWVEVAWCDGAGPAGAPQVCGTPMVGRRLARGNLCRVVVPP